MTFPIPKVKLKRLPQLHEKKLQPFTFHGDVPTLWKGRLEQLESRCQEKRQITYAQDNAEKSPPALPDAHIPGNALFSLEIS